MPTMQLELPARVSPADLEALQVDLEPYGSAYKLPAKSLVDPATAALAVSLLFEAVQAVDVLARWLAAWFQKHPQAHQATVRLADGRAIDIKSTDEEALRRALKAALKEL